MGSYSIKDLEQLSGIKAHTLRIWEKRYNLLHPKRTDTNIRFYSDDDLKKILNVSLLCNSGLKISKVASMPNNEVKAAIKSIDETSLKNQNRIDQLIIPMIDFDESQFNEYYKKYVEEIGVEKTFTEVIHPFLEKVGVLWLSDEVQPIQEHFITHIIRQKLCAAIENLPSTAEAERKVILFLPEGEYHELGLLYFSYLYKKHGVHVYYLGQSVPLDQVKKITKKISPDWVLSYSIIKSKKEIEEMLDEMKEFQAREVFFLENKYQEKFQLNYPLGVCQIKDYRQALQKID